MFSSRTDFTHDTAGISGQVLIATKFVWPYGGRTVSLIGSFTGWDLFSFLIYFAFYLCNCEFKKYHQNDWFNYRLLESAIRYFSEF